MLIAIGIIAALVLALLGYATTRPNHFRVERSLNIRASSERVFALINDFQTWRSWSPYEKLDPAMKKTYTGPQSRRGAVYAWDGNSKAGAGRMEIANSVPNSKVTIKLDFNRPFEGHNTAEFTLQPNGGTTKVTWALYGPQNFMMKVMSIFMNMDRMVGKDFDEGLANLKAQAEVEPKSTTAAL